MARTFEWDRDSSDETMTRDVFGALNEVTDVSTVEDIEVFILRGQRRQPMRELRRDPDSGSIIAFRASHPGIRGSSQFVDEVAVEPGQVEMLRFTIPDVDDTPLEQVVHMPPRMVGAFDPSRVRLLLGTSTMRLVRECAARDGHTNTTDVVGVLRRQGRFDEILPGESPEHQSLRFWLNAWATHAHASRAAHFHRGPQDCSKCMRLSRAVHDAAIVTLRTDAGSV